MCSFYCNDSICCLLVEWVSLKEKFSCSSEIVDVFGWFPTLLFCLKCVNMFVTEKQKLLTFVLGEMYVVESAEILRFGQFLQLRKLS